jgi:hypothetical protein
MARFHVSRKGPRNCRSRGRAALTFVISTEAKRSGEISVLTPPSWECFSTERSVVERSAVFIVIEEIPMGSLSNAS